MKQAEIFFQQTLAPAMDKLHQRWQDEKKYEDWLYYEKALTKVFENQADITLSKIEKSPFRVHFSVRGVKYVAQCNTKRVTMNEVK